MNGRPLYLKTQFEMRSNKNQSVYDVSGTSRCYHIKQARDAQGVPEN